jgi:hypothetical protein
MIRLENISTGEYFEGEYLEFIVDDLEGSVYLDEMLIFHCSDVVDEHQLELFFNDNFIQYDVDQYQQEF